MGVFEIFKDRRKEWRFRLKAKNHKVILQSEGYTSRSKTYRGIVSLRINAVNSEIVDLTKVKHGDRR